MRIALCTLVALSLLGLMAFAELEVSHERGIYTDGVRLTIRSNPPGATIRYTRDGSDPLTSTSATTYEGPISLAKTTSMRISEITKEGASTTLTHTYVFPGEVWSQPALPDGLATSAVSRRQGSQQFDWGMDPDLVTTDRQRTELATALTSLPVLAVTLAPEDFSFLYQNHQLRGVEFERAASIELIYPKSDRFEGMAGFQINCGLRMHGGLAVDQSRKKSFRLLFKKTYGAGKLRYPIFESAPNHAGSATDRFDTLVLRAGGNGNWSKDDAWKHEPGTQIRDPLVRDSQIAVSGMGSHSTFVHLFINGLYNGIYNIAERPDAKFLASYLGGEPESYVAINHGGIVDGDAAHWDKILRELREPGTGKAPIDVSHFCDYLIVNWIVGMGDWPWNNYYAGLPTSDNGQLRFFAWDSEYAFWAIRGYLVSNPGAWVHPHFLRTGGRSRNSPIVICWNALQNDPEFRMQFADRVALHCFGNGALTDASLLKRFERIAQALDPAIAAESVRWGDAAVGMEDNPRTRERNWLPNCDKIRLMMKGNSGRFITTLRRHGLFPSLDAPAITSPLKLVVDSGFELQLENPNAKGTILFTTDGTDPRQPGGERHSKAKEWRSGVVVTSPVHLKARVSSDGIWSAITERKLFTAPVGVPLRFTEIMFAPPGDQALEFIEIANLGPIAIDLTGYTLSGVDYRFAPGNVINAEQAVVLIPNDDPAMFAAKYPSVSTAGTYRKHLSNDGERLALLDATQQVVDALVYTVDGEDSKRLVGGGHSLERIAPASWMASDAPGGTPGIIPDQLAHQDTSKL